MKHFSAIRTSISLLAALLGFAAMTPAFAGGSDPQIILDDIYGQVSEMCGGDADGPPYDFVAIAKKYFTPQLSKKIEKASDDNAIDFDVLVDGQDCKLTELDLTVLDDTGKTAIGRAEFKNMGAERIVDLHMAKSGSSWEVTDITYRHRKFSLKTAF